MLYVQRTLEKLGLYLGVQASLDGVDSVERLVRKVGKRGSSDTGGSGSDAGKSAEGLEASAEDGARGSVEGLDVPNGDQLAVEYISDAVDSEQVEVVEPEAKEADSGQLSKDLGEEPERSEEQTANMADLFSGLDALDGGRDVADGKEVAVASVSSTEEPDSKAQTALNDPRHTILSHFFLLSVIDGLGYPPYARTLLRKLAAALQLDSYDVARIEAGLSAQLSIFGEEKVAMNDSDSDKMIGDRERKERIKRWAVTALAFAGGGALIGLSAGVMAPLIGAGVSATLGMVGVGGTAGFLGSTTGAAVIAAGGAGIGGTLSAKKMAKRTGRLGIFELLPVRPAYVAEGDDYVPLPYPSVTICVSGWLTEGESDFHAPWSTVSPGALGELHTLRWDPDDLVALGSAFKIITAEIISFGVTQFLGATVLHALMLGLTLPMWVAKLGYALDNPWGIGLSKAKKAGLVLADALAAQVQAHRPVTLVGFSLGARVVFYCLLELAQRGQTELVEDVYLAGAPVMATEAEWTQCVAAVSGRIVNGYLPGDWVLGLLYRASTATFAKVAGLHAVTGVEGLENVDLTGLVEGHLKYRVRMPRILEKFGVKVWREWIDEEDEEEWRQAREAEREAERKAKEPRSSSSAAEQAANLPLAKPKFEGTDPQLAEPAAAKEPEKSDIWTWQDILELKNIQDQMSGYFEPRNLGESTLPPLVIADDAFGEDGPSSAGAAVRKAVRRQDKEPEPDRSGMKLEMDALSDDESEPVSSRGPGSVAAMDSFAEEGSLGEVEPKVGGLDMDEVMDLLANGRAGGSYPELRAVMQAAEAAVGEQPTSGVQLTVDSVTQQQQQVYGYVDPAPPPQPAWYYGGMPPAPAQISPRIEPQLGYVDDSSRGYVDQGYVDQQPLEQILGAVSRSFERSRDSGGESPQLVEDRSSPRFAQGNESQVGNWQGYQASSGGEFASPAGATEYGQPADEGFNWSAVSSGQVTMPGIPLESTEPQEADADAADADVELDDELPESETVASVQTDFSGSTGSAGKRKKKKKGKKR